MFGDKTKTENWPRRAFLAVIGWNVLFGLHFSNLNIQFYCVQGTHLHFPQTFKMWITCLLRCRWWHVSVRVCETFFHRKPDRELQLPTDPTSKKNVPTSSGEKYRKYKIKRRKRHNTLLNFIALRVITYGTLLIWPCCQVIWEQSRPQPIWDEMNADNSPQRNIQRYL